MKRSEINQLIRDAESCFEAHGWTLPPTPRWDVTDFGLGHWREKGLVLVNLAEQPEYCEKLMYAKRGMTTPMHFHKKKKEDIISRWGSLAIKVYGASELLVNGETRPVSEGEIIILDSGERVTLVPGVRHAFWSVSDECIIGEVSTENDDLHDNFFEDPNIGRFPEIVEDEPPLVTLLSDN